MLHLKDGRAWRDLRVGGALGREGPRAGGALGRRGLRAGGAKDRRGDKHHGEEVKGE